MRRGFTLIEVLIVITIISILASIVTSSVFAAREKARAALALTFVTSASAAAEHHFLEAGRYPGTEAADGENAFPYLFQAVFVGTPGGPRPSIDLREREVLVLDAESAAYLEASTRQIYDPRVMKYVADPWGRPYVYRENRSRPTGTAVKRPGKFDLYSLGRDGIDQTILGEKGDDIGNW